MPSTTIQTNSLFVGGNAAVVSEDDRYRYLLRRRVGDNGRSCVFLMLNPSIADEFIDDPTIRRCKDFAARWGYGTLIVANLFAYRSTNPNMLYDVDDPIGPQNDEYIVAAALTAEAVICAWGNHGRLLNRSEKVVQLLRGHGTILYHLGLTQTNEPGHPLYKPKKLVPIPYV